MLTLVPGRIASFVALMLLFLVIGVTATLAKKGRVRFKVRRLAGLDAMQEAVARATETGKPVLFSPGGSELSLSSSLGPMLIAGISVLGYVARLTAKMNAKLTAWIAQGDVLALAEESINQSYLVEGREFPRDVLRFAPAGQSFNLGVTGWIRRERPAAAILVGPFTAEAIMLAENAFRVGAISIAGTARLLQVPFFVAVCDYVLIGEEVYAAGAYLSEDPVQAAFLAAQDCGKISSMTLMVLLAILSTLGITWLLNMLRM